MKRKRRESLGSNPAAFAFLSRAPFGEVPGLPAAAVVEALSLRAPQQFLGCVVRLHKSDTKRGCMRLRFRSAEIPEFLFSGGGRLASDCAVSHIYGRSSDHNQCLFEEKLRKLRLMLEQIKYFDVL